LAVKGDIIARLTHSISFEDFPQNFGG